MVLEVLVSLADVAMAIFVLAIIIGGIYIYNSVKKEKEDRKNGVSPADTQSAKQKELTYNAYERLIVLAERIALPNLISRLNDSSFSAREMQTILNENIKQEFEHNVSQQIYVTPDAWSAVKNLKEQNQLAVNQIAALMPANATALDLNKQILDFIMNHPKGNLHTLVQEAISFEAKKTN
jgi:hypothetical protein